jgi:hypothetical protein
VLAKGFADKPFGPISIDGRTQLPRDSDSQPRDAAIVSSREDRHQATGGL